MHFGTLAIHTGIEPDPVTGAVIPPIYQTSTYIQEAFGKHKGYIYSRGGNPTRTLLQKNIAALEGGKFALSFSSGMAAIDTVIKLLNTKDEVIVSNDLYGGAYRMFTGVFARLGIKFHFVDFEDSENVEAHINERTRLFWVETPSNPLIRIIDIKKYATLAHKHNILLTVDNTFASPYLQQPLAFGADIVMHSVTKYLGGHSDLIMGALVTNDDTLNSRLAFIQNSCGPIPSPHGCFLVLRGIKTLHLRMERHCYNGEKIAHFLNHHSKVKHVYWPGLPNHPGHAIAKQQMSAFGGILSFALKRESPEAVNKLLCNTALFLTAESLGGVESLVSHPASMTHASIPREERLKNGITDSLIRLSVGIEDADDLITDLDKALSEI